MEISLLTYNIHKGFRSGGKSFVLREIRDLIRDTGVDLVFLQEVVGESNRHRRIISGWPEKSQYEYLADEVWSQYSYGKNSAYEGGHHGNAILSRFPIESTNNLNISTNRVEKRGLLHARVKIPETDFIINACCTHLNLTKKSQITQVETVSDWIIKNTEEKLPLILAGDFNDWTDHASETLRRKAGLQEVIKLKEGKLRATFPAYYPLLKLDRIYVRGVEVIEANVQTEKVWKKLSDHVPVIAKVRIGRE